MKSNLKTYIETIPEVADEWRFLRSNFESAKVHIKLFNNNQKKQPFDRTALGMMVLNFVEAATSAKIILDAYEEEEGLPPFSGISIRFLDNHDDGVDFPEDGSHPAP